jgi:hypothetical protein
VSAPELIRECRDVLDYLGASPPSGAGQPSLDREEMEVLLDDGFPIPEHEKPVYVSAQAKLRAALSAPRETREGE